MNKKRRKEIDNINRDISYIIDKIKIIKRNLENVQSDEQDTFDSIPENLQYSMRGEESQDAIDNMEDALDSLEEAIDSLQEII